MPVMPKTYPTEYRDDVAVCAQRRKLEVATKGISEGFDHGNTCPRN